MLVFYFNSAEKWIKLYNRCTVCLFKNISELIKYDYDNDDDDDDDDEDGVKQNNKKKMIYYEQHNTSTNNMVLSNKCLWKAIQANFAIFCMLFVL